MKELKVRPGTDVHDYEVRLRAAQKFLAKVSSSKPMKSGISLLVGIQKLIVQAYVSSDADCADMCTAL